jgi:hypothetical protein
LPQINTDTAIHGIVIRKARKAFAKGGEAVIRKREKSIFPGFRINCFAPDDEWPNSYPLHPIHLWLKLSFVFLVMLFKFF